MIPKPLLSAIVSYFFCEKARQIKSWGGGLIVVGEVAVQRAERSQARGRMTGRAESLA